MSDNEALMAEAYKRGILPPEKKAAYEEAMKRGLIGKSKETKPDAPAQRPGAREGFPYDQPGKSYGNVLPFASDDKTGKLEFALPEAIRAPFRGAMSIGQQVTPGANTQPTADAQGNPVQPEPFRRQLSGDEMSALAMGAGDLKFGSQQVPISSVGKPPMGAPMSRDALNLPPRALTPEELKAAETGVSNLPQPPANGPSSMQTIGNLAKGTMYGTKALWDAATLHPLGAMHSGAQSYRAFKEVFKATPGKDLLKTFPGENTKKIMNPWSEPGA